LRGAYSPSALRDIENNVGVQYLYSIKKIC